ncbi:MAG: hypothetical protein ACI9OJ_001804 [Myxococcota bacterium]|jgi:hypothetical protein
MLSNINRLSLGLFVLAQLSCSPATDEEKFVGGDSQTSGIPPVGLGIGGECGKTSECRPGLTCAADGVCVPGATQGVGQSCFVGPECQDGLYCGAARVCTINDVPQVGSTCGSDSDCGDFGKDARCSNDITQSNQQCQPQGEGELDEICTLDSDCLAGFRCAYTAGFSGSCSPTGTVDYGGNCADSGECYAGLVCSGDSICTSWLEALITAVQWTGEVCDGDDLENPRVYFELPGPDGSPRTDFYRLPYPNDVRMKAGHVAKGHPSPGAAPLDFDVIERVVNAAGSAMDGWGTTPTIFFRFSAPIDFDSVTYDQGADNNLVYVNIDTDSPAYGNEQGYGWQAIGSRGKFVCQNYMTLRNGWGGPLFPSTTYAAFMRRGIRTTTENGAGLLNADADLQKMLSGSAPGGTADEAWAKYAPLRAYLADKGIPVADVIGATVFTTAGVTDVLPKAREVVRAEPAPVLSDVTLCGDGVVSPCAIEGVSSRACSNTSEFHEIQGRIRMPRFQQGTAPYLSPEDGGGLSLSAGVPLTTGTEDVCFSLTIPKNATMPTGGWPVVLYSHGTGGNFRSHVGVVAQSLSGGEAPSAVLGIDGVMHGPRKGETELEADVLFFNFANPVAARGNVYQAAIDYFTLARWVDEFSGDLASFPALTFDTNKVGFYGHSQGATTGPLMLANEPIIDIAVLSGAGSGLIASLLNKTSPVDIPAGLEGVLREQPGETHPVLSLLQQFFDPVDSVNYVKHITREPFENNQQTHLMLVYGKDDTFTPPSTTRILADNLEIPLVKPALSSSSDEAFGGYNVDRVVDGPLPLDPPLRPVTYGMVHYASDGTYDGHFVSTRNPGARSQIAEFFRTYFATGTPVISTPAN